MGLRKGSGRRNRSCGRNPPIVEKNTQPATLRRIQNTMRINGRTIVAQMRARTRGRSANALRKAFRPPILIRNLGPAARLSRSRAETQDEVQNEVRGAVRIPNLNSIMQIAPVMFAGAAGAHCRRLEPPGTVAASTMSLVTSMATVSMPILTVWPCKAA